MLEKKIAVFMKHTSVTRVHILVSWNMDCSWNTISLTRGHILVLWNLISNISSLIVGFKKIFSMGNKGTCSRRIFFRLRVLHVIHVAWIDIYFWHLIANDNSCFGYTSAAWLIMYLVNNSILCFEYFSFCLHNLSFLISLGSFPTIH